MAGCTSTVWLDVPLLYGWMYLYCMAGCTSTVWLDVPLLYGWMYLYCMAGCTSTVWLVAVYVNPTFASLGTREVRLAHTGQHENIISKNIKDVDLFLFNVRFLANVKSFSSKIKAIHSFFGFNNRVNNDYIKL